MDILTFNALKQHQRYLDRDLLDPWKRPAFAVVTMSSSAPWGAVVYNHYLQELCRQHYNDSGYMQGSTSSLGTEFFNNWYTYGRTDSNISSTDSNYGDGTARCGHLGHIALGVGPDGSMIGRPSPYAGTALRNVGVWVNNKTNKNLALFMENQYAGVAPRAIAPGRLTGTEGWHLAWTNTKFYAQNNFGTYNKYGMIGYNEKTGTLVINENKNGGTSMRLHVYSNVPPFDISASNRRAWFNNLDETKHIFYDWTANSAGYAESLYRGIVIPCDDGKIIIVRMEPNNYCMLDRFTPNGAGSYTKEATHTLSTTTTYGMESADRNGIRFQISNDGKYVICYQPYYYYGAGAEVFLIRVSDGKYAFLQYQDSSYGRSFAPIRDSDFMISYSPNSDSGYLGPMAAVAMGYTAAGSAAAMATAGIALAGSMLINTVIPAPKPSMPSLNWGGSGSTPAPSPTYSIQAQGNQGRLGQPIPVIYGRHLIYPDLASEPYQDYVGGEQYLYQLHVIGQGEYAVEQIRIEDTPISSFEEVQTETVPPGSPVTLFEPDVVTAAEVAGQELVAPNLVASGDDGYIGPFTANPVDTTAGALGIDVVMPRGLYYANDGGSLDSRTVQWQVEALAIDAEGGAIGGWAVLAQPSHTAATNSTIRLSFRYSVSPGRYEVRLKRLDTKDTAERAGHEIRWGALRAYLTGQPDFGSVTLLAVKMRATDNLSQRSSRMINIIATRKLPVWSAAGGWSAPQPTRSIAWAFADACKADYGAKLADSRIDLKTLATLDAIWQGRGDTFDAVFDTSMTVWEALSRIARCGRAVPIQQGGIVRIIRDAPQTMPVAMFGPRNIVKGSFKIKYVMPGDDTADAVTVEYFSSRTWKPDETTAKLPDSQGDNPAKVNLFGCTAKDHAQREGLYIAANNRYRRRMVTFRTELEGMIPTYGDLVAITHDMPRWGQGGEVIDWRAESTKPPWIGAVLMLSEPLTWTEGASHYLALRRRDGSLAGPFRVEPVADAPTMVRLAEPLTVTPYTGGSEERTYFSFGPGQAWAQTARILTIRPRSEQVEITAVAEDARVHVN